MRASYFNDYESYAVDNGGNRYEMRNDRIWYRNAKIFNDYCVVGKDFISNDYGRKRSGWSAPLRIAAMVRCQSSPATDLMTTFP